MKTKPIKLEKIKVQINDIPYTYLDFDLIEGEIHEVSEKILNIKDKLKEAHKLRENSLKKEVSFTPFEDYQYILIKTRYDYDDNKELCIEVWRDETDEEYKERSEINKKRSESAKLAAENRKIAQIKREKTLLENLKKKYEKN